MSTTKVLAIIINLFLPGLGNIIAGQTKFGLSVLVASLLLSVFYFLPFTYLLLIGSNAASVILLCTCGLAVVALLVDIALIIWSIIKVINLESQTS